MYLFYTKLDRAVGDIPVELQALSYLGYPSIQPSIPAIRARHKVTGMEIYISFLATSNATALLLWKIWKIF